MRGFPWKAAWLCALVAPAQAQPPPASPPPPATSQAIQNAFAQGATLVGALEGYIWTERYAPDGSFRGRYRGQDYAGRWTNENGELCTQPEGRAKTCHDLYGDIAGPWRDPTYLMLVQTRLPSTAMPTPLPPAYYRRAEPERTRSPMQTIEGVVEEVLNDGLRLRPGAVPLAEDIYITSAGRPQVSPGMRVRIEGSTDGVTFRATRIATP